MTAPLRDALAMALLAAWGPTTTPHDHADTILDLLVEHREQVLTHLGMTAVGRFGPGGFDGDGWLDGVEVYVKYKGDALTSQGEPS